MTPSSVARLKMKSRGLFQVSIVQRSAETSHEDLLDGKARTPMKVPIVSLLCVLTALEETQGMEPDSSV